MRHGGVVLLNYLVDAGDYLRMNFKTWRLSSLEVDH
jgi:hypothetical protein